MKSFLIPVFLLLSFVGFAQDLVQPIILNDKDTGKVNIQELAIQTGRHMYIFWSVNDKNSCAFLVKANQVFTDWESDYNLKVTVINVDNPSLRKKADGFIAKKGLRFNFIYDPENKTKPVFRHSVLPHICILSEGKVVKTMVGYSPNDEMLVDENLSALFDDM